MLSNNKKSCVASQVWPQQSSEVFFKVTRNSHIFCPGETYLYGELDQMMRKKKLSQGFCTVRAQIMYSIDGWQNKLNSLRDAFYIFAFKDMVSNKVFNFS